LISLSDPHNLKKTIFIYPEGIITGIYLKDLKFFKDIFKDNYNTNHKVILGINSINQNKIYNSLIVLNNESELLYKYNKNKLVPFGEFLPFENFFKRIGLKKITQGYQSFSADDKREILEMNQLKFVPLICYEIIYSGKINPNKNYYDFILNISEDGWFGKTIGPQQHLSHSIFRSIEEGKNVIRSTNNGISAFVNPKGQIIKQITEKGYFDVKKIKRVNKTYFAKYGNKIFFYFVLIYTTFIVILKIRENK
jgi:apolipoprotein N-acyltransferase